MTSCLKPRFSWPPTSWFHRENMDFWYGVGWVLVDGKFCSFSPKAPNLSQGFDDASVEKKIQLDRRSLSENRRACVTSPVIWENFQSVEFDSGKKKAAMSGFPHWPAFQGLKKNQVKYLQMVRLTCKRVLDNDKKTVGPSLKTLNH